jgi:hypothetical protein
MAELSDVVKRLDAITALLFLLPEPSERRSLRDQNKTVRRSWHGPLRNREDRGQTQPAVNSELARIRGKKAKKRWTKE